MVGRSLSAFILTFILSRFLKLFYSELLIKI